MKIHSCYSEGYWFHKAILNAIKNPDVAWIDCNMTIKFCTLTTYYFD